MGQSHDTHTHKHNLGSSLGATVSVQTEVRSVLEDKHTHTHKDTHVHPIRSKQRARGKSFRVLITDPH